MVLSSFVSPKYKKYLVNAILICGAFHAIYAIGQINQWPGVRVYTHTFKQFDATLNRMVDGETVIWALGCTTNPNIFGAYMMLCLSYSMALFVESKKIAHKIIYAIAILLFMFGIMIANCSASVVAIGIVFFFLLIYCIKNKCFKQWLIIALLLASMVGTAIKIDKIRLLRDIRDTANETTQIAKGNSNENMGTNRMFIWKETLNIVPQNLSHGVGIDNYYYAFNGRPLRYKNYAFDKAHNEYLQTLVTQGIFAVISYIALFGYVAFCGLRRGFKHKEIYLVLPVIGYAIQEFFSISVIELAPIFYIALGLCGSKNKEEVNN